MAATRRAAAPAAPRAPAARAAPAPRRRPRAPRPARAGAGEGGGQPQEAPPAAQQPPAAADPPQQPPKARRKAGSTDAIASFMTRRFGLAGGLAWLGFLAVGTLGEQVKTRLEVAAEREGARDVAAQAEVTLPSGVSYVDERVGGGGAPAKGMLVVLSYSAATSEGVTFEDTRARGKPIVFLYGSRPFTGGICAGVEEALSTMRAGGRRRVTVPPALGFGDRGAVLRPTEHVPDKQGVVPPGATLVYDLQLERVSVPPS
ncbi:hypothetical protein Rsub_10059 [Raphidocelis subcapitata]|uniref:peptidylprolyl isomerase n=1 Tax=Raphidocelis subcapitata TaxID=307507 RepID=A0A2V0PBG5_9CHLO|nr:hypothetical protein Rsub_10059 [Raphidocelis subcapitata]|eukprot:GBF97198.1 hypothetical protein Rsub_10059 [Raphidocelis subcapitata]